MPQRLSGSSKSKLHTEEEQGWKVGQDLQALQQPGWLVRDVLFDGAAAVFFFSCIAVLVRDIVGQQLE